MLCYLTYYEKMSQKSNFCPLDSKVWSKREEFGSISSFLESHGTLLGNPGQGAKGS